MSLVDAVNTYVGVGLGLLVAALLLGGLVSLNARLPRPFAPRQLLCIGYALLAAAVLAPLLAVLLPGDGALLPAPVQVWAGARMDASPDALITPLTTSITVHAMPAPAGWLTAALLVAGVLGCGVLVMIARLAGELRRAWHLTSRATPLRRRGRGIVLVTDDTDVPFSCWFPGRYFVAIPSAWVLRPAEMRIALRHEAWHHRHGDTRLIVPLQLLRALYWYHPGVHVLVRRLLELQEFACDSAASGRCAERREAYCRCLLHTADHMRLPPPRAAAGILGHSRGVLLQRVRATLRPPAALLSTRASVIVGVVAATLLGSLAAIGAAPVHDRRIDLATAERLADVARRDTSFPVVVNEDVVAELNALLGTRDGRAFLRGSLERMAEYQPRIEAELDRAGLPRALLAVPLVESGFRNRIAGIGGGLWMFIAPTARRFGLHVDPERDERLDVSRETDAALRMLGDLHQRFGDWHLALLAYNRGEAHVEKALRNSGHRDAFALLTRNGPDAVYLPRVMAAVLVLADPRIAD